MSIPFATLLLTGAAGTLGRQLAPGLADLARQTVLTDLAGPLAALGPPTDAAVVHRPCDLADGAALQALLRGVDAVVHLGGVSYEKPFDVVAAANIQGLFNLYEAAREAGTRRIVFASSNHVTGCYGVDERIGPEAPARPDGNYGLSKLFGEGLAHLYWDRHGIQTVCLRIGTATPRPIDRRSLSTWISPRDLLQLVRCALTAADVGCLVAYGMSGNTRAWWDTAAAWQRLGFVPQDDAEAHAADVADLTFPAGSAMARCQGGSFLGIGPFPHLPHESALAPSPKETPP